MKYRKEKLLVLIKWPYTVVYFVILVLIFVIYETEITDMVKKSLKVEERVVKIDHTDGFLVKTTGCRIPKLDAFDQAIMPYVFRPEHFVCSSKRALVESNLTSIYINPDALEDYNISDISQLDCCYKHFWRFDKSDNNGLSNLFGFGQCKNFTYESKIDVEYIRVFCHYNKKKIYRDFFSFVPEKRKEIPNRKAEEKLNVLFIGLDAISRLNLHRTMPNFIKYMVDELGAYEFVGYNKVADNTFPNVIPIFTGLSESELGEVCWPSPKHFFDKCPFIWKEFSLRNYLTSFTEDAAWMGIFNYGKVGFKNQPTDYFWPTFAFLAEKYIGHSKLFNAHLCMGVRPTYLVILDYLYKFVNRNLKKPFFGFFWENSLSHDNLNFPFMGDGNYRYFFEELKNTTVLNKTVLIVLSDHGIRWGGIRTTHQGQLEERLPFLFFILPDWFKRKYSTAVANLKRNTKRLTTPFDLHETIKDILDIDEKIGSSEKIKLRLNETNNRGVSLFLPIPENRTCETAEISSHWCTCQISSAVPTTDVLVQKIGQFLVSEINKMLQGNWECAQLSLKDILDARILKTEEFETTNLMIHDYILIIRTLPGEGMFEGTVRLYKSENEDPKSENVNKNEKFSLISTVSRINLYGKQSACVTDFHLKLYCYCLR